MLRFSFMFMVSILALLCQLAMAGIAGEKGVSLVIAAGERFIDNGDGTVIDTRRQLMWQKGDNGNEVTFENAEQYCKVLRVGGYTDWRLPKPDELDTAVMVELRTAIHSRDAYARFDLFWSSDPTTLIPFNYRPSLGKEVSRVYPARQGTRAFVRAVRSLAPDKPANG